MRLVSTTTVGAIVSAFLLLVCGCGQSTGPAVEDRSVEVRKVSVEPSANTEVAGDATNGAIAFTLTGGATPEMGPPGADGLLSLPQAPVEAQMLGTAPLSNRGRIVLPDGSNYEGEISGGKPNGQGTGTWPDGKTYVGEFRNGQAEGAGTVVEPNGTRQEGEWRGGAEYRVRGTWVAADGTKEEGTWNRDGTASGGTITWKDGRQYRGEWKLVPGMPESPDGAGEMRWPDGRQYVGQFHDGKMDGPGRMIYPGGKIEDGVWKQDTFTGAAK